MNDKLPDGFNWIAVLKDLAHGAPISRSERFKLKRLAGNWPTCACGQLCDALPRSATNAPRDGMLIGLGHIFYHQIDGAEWHKALATFYKIEDRTKILIESIN